MKNNKKIVKLFSFLLITSFFVFVSLQAVSGDEKKKDYYKILGVDRNASYRDIKEAYKKGVLRFHNDKNTDDTYDNEKFLEIKHAYKVLSVLETKILYDLGIPLKDINNLLSGDVNGVYTKLEPDLIESGLLEKCVVDAQTGEEKPLTKEEVTKRVKIRILLLGIYEKLKGFEEVQLRQYNEGQLLKIVIDMLNDDENLTEEDRKLLNKFVKEGSLRKLSKKERETLSNGVLKEHLNSNDVKIKSEEDIIPKLLYGIVKELLKREDIIEFLKNNSEKKKDMLHLKDHGELYATTWFREKKGTINQIEHNENMENIIKACDEKKHKKMWATSAFVVCFVSALGINKLINRWKNYKEDRLRQKVQKDDFLHPPTSRIPQERRAKERGFRMKMNDIEDKAISLKFGIVQFWLVGALLSAFVYWQA